jgi:hypothetical protein
MPRVGACAPIVAPSPPALHQRERQRGRRGQLVAYDLDIPPSEADTPSDGGGSMSERSFIRFMNNKGAGDGEADFGRRHTAAAERPV